MERDRWKQIELLYHAALEREPDARDAFLDEACEGDEDLRREVAALLACDISSDSFIQSPAIEIAARAMAAEPLIEASNEPLGSLIAESQIGVYQLLEPLGRGGMGEVHLALDARLGRKVAIKLLPEAFTTDASRVKRFAQEARAASALNHPNIITIHEIGETEAENGSLRYIVTEYVEGETLRQRMASAPQQRIKAAEAIEIAAQIAAALSPDGKLISYFGMNKQNHPALNIFPFERGAISKTIDLPTSVRLSINHVWTPDGRAIIYSQSIGDVSNLWKRPLDGGAPTQLTDFKSGGFSWFALSRDGKQLALSRYIPGGEVVLISNFR